VKRAPKGPVDPAATIASAQKVEKYARLRDEVIRRRKSKQYDEESLKLTSDLLAINPEFYTVWNYRRELLRALWQTKTAAEVDKLREDELRLLQQALIANPKSYCVWEHRRWIIGNYSGNLQQELALCSKALDLDERNFHCWHYRLDISRSAKESPKDFLNFTTRKINQNFSNYSAWHYRSKFYPLVLKDSSNGQSCYLTGSLLEKELDFVQQAFYTEPEDQSTWLYYRWLLHQHKESGEGNHMALIQQEIGRMEALLEAEPNCKYALLQLALLLTQEDKSVESREKARNIFCQLEDLDGTRKLHYQDMASALQN